jgi:hypothetical protein
MPDTPETGAILTAADAEVVGCELDEQLVDEWTCEVLMDDDAHELVNWAYDLVCSAFRGALIGMTCWSPKTARRSLQSQAHVNWGSLRDSPNGFLNMMKSALDAFRSAQAEPNAQEEQPSLADFAACYRQLFRTTDETLQGPFQRARKHVKAIVLEESTSIAEFLVRAKWRKAIRARQYPHGLV